MNKQDRPDYRSGAYERMAQDWLLVQSIYSGVRAVRDAQLLNQFEKESKDDYKKRIQESEFYNVYQSTLDSCVGMVFSNDVSPQEITPRLEEFLADIDLAGNDINMFLRQTFLNGIRDGHSYIFVDMPPTSEVRTLADGARPYWINYTADQVLNWRFVTEAGRVHLDQCTIYEPKLEPDGMYGEKMVEFYKVFHRGGAYEVYRKKDDDFILEEEGSIGLSEIPLVPFYANKVRPYESCPPYLDLADTNCKHYDAQSRLRKALSYVIPVPVFKVQDENDAKKFAQLTMASDRAIIMWGEASAEYLELKGDSVPALERDIEKLEERMAKLGIEKFAPMDDAGAKTAYEIGSDNRREFSELAVMAKNLENCVESAFDCTLEYMGESADADLNLNIDYDRLTYSVEELRLFSQMVKDGQLSLRTYLNHLPNMVPMPDDYDPETELEQLRQERISSFLPIGDDGLPVRPQTADEFTEL